MDGIPKLENIEGTREDASGSSASNLGVDGKSNAGLGDGGNHAGLGKVKEGVGSDLEPVKSGIEGELKRLKELIGDEGEVVGSEVGASTPELNLAKDQRDIEEARSSLSEEGVEGLKNDLAGESAAGEQDKTKKVTILHVGGKKPLARNFEPIDEVAITREVGERRAKEEKRKKHLEAMNSELAIVARVHINRFTNELNDQKIEGRLQEEVVNKRSWFEKKRGKHDDVIDVATFGFLTEDGYKYETRIQTLPRADVDNAGYSLSLASAEVSHFSPKGGRGASVKVDFSESSGLPAKVELLTPFAFEDMKSGLYRFDEYTKSGGVLEAILKPASRLVVQDADVEWNFMMGATKTIKERVVKMRQPKFNFSYDPLNAETPLQLTITDASPRNEKNPLMLVSYYSAENDLVTFGTGSRHSDSELVDSLTLSGKEFTQLFDEVLSIIPDNPYDRGMRPTGETT